LKLVSEPFRTGRPAADAGDRAPAVAILVDSRVGGWLVRVTRRKADIFRPMLPAQLTMRAETMRTAPHHGI